MIQRPKTRHCLFALAIALCGTTLSPAAERPNIILIMADDMGYSDIGCYGGEIKTPNLDKLAASGLRFTQFYNTGRCCPTRATLLTGLYAHQAGIGHMTGDRNLEGYQGDLNRRCQTIAEVLRPAGYSTYLSGKWHVTKATRPKSLADKFNWPLQRGFDRFFGTIHGAGSFYDPNTLTRDNEFIAPDSPEFFYTDAISENAAKFINEHDQAKPFFMYVAYTAPHWPMHARPHNIAKYKGVYDKGWDAMREERHQRMIDMGLVKKKWPLTPRDKRAPAFEDAELKEWELRNMEVYAAMIDCMDQGIGQVVDALKKTDQIDNTLILFFADNGGCAEGKGRGKIHPPTTTEGSALKPMKPGELQYDMVPKVSRDGRPVRYGKGVMPGPADTFVAYGLGWANASNTPFRLYKQRVHEGGIASPLIAHWPKGIRKDRQGKLEHQPGHLIDLMATAVDLGGAKYPREIDGTKIIPMQGVSLRPALDGKSLDRKQPLFWEHQGNRAIRIGKWKLVADGPHEPWELYDLEADRTELSNLAETHPERAREMAARWDAWSIEAKVKPWPWDKRKKRR